MLEEFVSLGKWWLPNKPEVVIAGKLSFSPESGATLKLIGSFYSSPFQDIDQVRDIALLNENFIFEEESRPTSYVEVGFINHDETIILGLLDNNEEITLYKCSGQIKSFEFVKGRQILCFNVEYIFRKIHFEDEQNIKLKSISVQYSHLEKWVGKSGIKVFASQDENKIWISYQPPSKINLRKIANLDLDITFSQPYINPFDLYFGNVYYKASIEQKTYLSIQNPCNQPIGECINLLLEFRDFLSFAMTKPTSIIEITGTTDVVHNKPVMQVNGDITLEQEQRETQVIILFGFWNSKKNAEINISSDNMLFLLSDIEDELGLVFETWINKRDEYESVFDLLMTTMYTPNLYLHYKFLNIIQALEAYHTSKHEGIYQDQKVYLGGLYKKLREVLEKFPSNDIDKKNGISDEFRNALKGKLKSQTRFTLETRLNEILAEISPFVPDDFIGSYSDKIKFAHRAADTRNTLTHHDKEKRNQAAKGRELFQLFHTLTVVLQVCLMRELNLNSDSIESLVRRSRAYQNEWRPSSEQVEAISLSRPQKEVVQNRYPLRGTPIQYTDPTQPVAQDDWDILQ